MRKYLITYLSTLGLLVTAAVTFNWLVNPFGIFSSPQIEGLNVVKPQLATSDRMAKAYISRRLEADLIAQGTSRAYVGISDRHPVLQQYTFFNAALLGSTAYEMLRYFQHMNAIHPLKASIYGLDMFSFNTMRDQNSDFSEERLLVDSEGNENKHSTLRYVKDVLTTLISYDGLEQSVRTVMKQDMELGITMTIDDMSSFNSLRHLAKHGIRRGFLLNEAEYAHNIWCPKPALTFSLDTTDGSPSQLDYLRQQMQYAYRHDIKLYLFVSPIHARLLEAMHKVGLWPYFEEWKRRIVRMNEEEAKAAGQQPFPIWDFTGYNSLTTEEVPPYKDKLATMTYYWESSHYKHPMGNLILDRLFSNRREGFEVPQDFGIPINSANIESHLAEINTSRTAYQQRWPKDVKEIQSLKVSPATCSFEEPQQP